MILFTRTLPDGRRLDVLPLLGGRARLGLALADDHTWYVDVW